MVGQVWNSQGSPEVNDHEFKVQPISMVMSFSSKQFTYVGASIRLAKGCFIES